MNQKRISQFAFVCLCLLTVGALAFPVFAATKHRTTSTADLSRDRPVPWKDLSWLWLYVKYDSATGYDQVYLQYHNPYDSSVLEEIRLTATTFNKSNPLFPHTPGTTGSVNAFSSLTYYSSSSLMTPTFNGFCIPFYFLKEVSGNNELTLGCIEETSFIAFLS